MPINLSVFFLGSMAVAFFGYYVIWPLLRWLKELYLVGFDIWPYLKELNFAINVLNFDLGKMFMIYLTLFLSVLTFLIAHFLHQERLSKRTTTRRNRTSRSSSAPTNGNASSVRQGHFSLA